MSAINDAIRAVNYGIDVVVEYLKGNAVAIGGLLVVVYVYKNYVSKNQAMGQGYTLSSSSQQASSSSTRGIAFMSTSSAADEDASRAEKMRLVRLRQQEIATERVKQAALLRIRMEAAERKRKNDINGRKKKKSGDAVGGSSSSAASGYNPMQPGSSGTGGYRAQRRTVRRG
eukprot:CAMPEP_0119556768 /NCGR_PEP_ID=MMETSP1352-20130426/8615_1 /TAXON_ID=265584 /ORGANISM="Stauroneis constricta, Strain CCMP1120" /LENGTH=171 /DNA_ID=CAMNT_0007603761 /DNA_START=75 /DNA_END=590 /DNA_ORIENTATION=-